MHVLILVARAVGNMHIGLNGMQKHVLSPCTCSHLAVGGLREGLKVDVRGLVVIFRCWKIYYVHKSPHKPGSVSVFLYLLHSEDRNIHFEWQH